jgi:hypothetical protein
LDRNDPAIGFYERVEGLSLDRLVRLVGVDLALLGIYQPSRAPFSVYSRIFAWGYARPISRSPAILSSVRASREAFVENSARTDTFDRRGAS